MKILFISYAGISLSCGNIRAVAMLYALADAGHRVDLLAPSVDLPDHPHIHLLMGAGAKPARRGRLRVAALRATGRIHYDAMHAVDDAVFFAVRLCRLRRVPLMYDALRRFAGRGGSVVHRRRHLFPKRLQRLETTVLERAAIVFSTCSALTADLRAANKQARIVQLEDIPFQSLHFGLRAEMRTPLQRYGRHTGYIVVCVVLPGCGLSLRTSFMAARELLDAEPETTFYFRGIARGQMEKMATNLDIGSRCRFLAPDEPTAYLAALETADAVLMLPPTGMRYMDPQIYTLLQTGAPLVTIHDAVYDELLDDSTSVRVLPSPEAMAEGLLRVFHEPLFSLAIAMEAQQRVASRHTFSSFKHKVRMTYRELT